MFVNLALCLELVIHWSFYRRLEQNWYEPHGTPRRMGTLTGAVSSRADTPRDGSLVGNLTLLVEWTQNWWEPRRKPQSGEFLPFSTDNKTGGNPWAWKISLEQRLPSFDGSVENRMRKFTRVAVFRVTVVGCSPCENSCRTSDFKSFFACVCCLLYTSPSPRDMTISRMPSSA